MDIAWGRFVWDAEKEQLNVEKHGIDFQEASRVFMDPRRRIYVDSRHSLKEPRYFCIGKVGARILTVRFVYRHEKIRIFGAGSWRKGRSYYDQKETD